VKNLLIVAHCPSQNTKRLADALFDGAQDCDTPLHVQLLSPFEAKYPIIATADGVILFTTENFGYMSGAMKDMFDRTYYDLIDLKRGMPYALVIRAGKDGTGSTRAIESITKGLGWSKIQDTLVLRGEFQQPFVKETRVLGQAFAMGLCEGIF